jgi:para-nitrobenzyl esterase
MISSYFVNFAATGNPNGQGLPQWPAFAENNAKYMFFNEFSRAMPVPNTDKLKIWDAYYSWLREQEKK